MPPRRKRHKRRGAFPVLFPAPKPVDPAHPVESEEEEIIEIHARHYERLGRAWSFGKTWLRRAVGVAITVLIFIYILRPIRQQWPDVKEGILATSVWRLLLASAMFALFLAFRALSWRRILIGFGRRLPFAPALRIWITSELARYLPGAVWQVIGRVYLVRPYGVSGSVCTTSQILEVSVFLLANLLVAVACLIYYGAKINPVARPWFYAAMVLVPVLALVLHPKIFYGLINRILKRIGKEPIVQRLSGFALTRLLLRLVIALLWQSFAVYILVQPVLHLIPDWWWMVAGAYCLAWSAGFLAFWAPGGIGVRELVFIAAMQVVLPPQVEASRALLGYLAVLLRLWTIAGELLLAIVAYALDYRGALGRPDAPGRVTAPVTEPVEEPAELAR